MPGATYGVVKANARLGYQFSDEWSLHIFEDLFHGDGILNGGSHLGRLWCEQEGSQSIYDLR